MDYCNALVVDKFISQLIFIIEALHLVTICFTVTPCHIKCDIQILKED